MTSYSEKRNELYDLVNNLVTDVEFYYQGKQGSICPLSKTKIIFAFDGKDKEFNDIDKLFSEKLINGNSLNEIASQLELDY